MTEKEKMIAGMIYDANYDEELLRERTKAKELCHVYNYLVKPSEIEKQNKILKKCENYILNYLKFYNVKQKMNKI